MNAIMKGLPWKSMLWVVAVVLVTGLTAGLLTLLILRQSPGVKDEVLTGLKAPRGLTLLDNGELLVSEVLGGRLLRISPEGEATVVQEGLPATLGGPGGGYPTGVSSAIKIEQTYYYVVGEFRGSRYSALYRLGPQGSPQMLAGGVGPDGFPASRLTNPYDLVPAPEGGLLVSDSGVNAVLHISEEGLISDYVTFPQKKLSTPQGRRSIDVVPTGLTLGPDGAVYLASFTGHPYPPKAANIYRLEDINGDGDAMDEGETIVFAEGFSVATDLVFEEDGSLLVTEFSTDMTRLVQEFGTEMAAAIPGRLVHWRNGTTQVVAEGLVSPTSVAVVGERIFISEEFAGTVSEIGVSNRTDSVAWLWPVVVGLVSVFIQGAGVSWRCRKIRP
jgi:hypothetical protein